MSNYLIILKDAEIFQKSVVNNFSSMDLQKELVEAVKDFVRRDSENVNHDVDITKRIFHFIVELQKGFLKTPTIQREETEYKKADIRALRELFPFLYILYFIDCTSFIYIIFNKIGAKVSAAFFGSDFLVHFLLHFSSIFKVLDHFPEIVSAISFNTMLYKSSLPLGKYTRLFVWHAQG